MTIIIGVDPGMSGAIALVDSSYGVLIDVYDMPVVGKLVSPELILDLENWHEDTYGPAVIEDVHSMPKQGVVSSFGFGRSKGVVEGVFAGCGIPLVYVTPQAWKKALGLSSDKEMSRQMAIRLWPQHAEKFKLKKHADRAEAALIAYWYQQKGQA